MMPTRTLALVMFSFLVTGPVSASVAPTAVPALDNWGLVLMIGVLGGVFGRWLMGRGRRK